MALAILIGSFFGYLVFKSRYTLVSYSSRQTLLQGSLMATWVTSVSIVFQFSNYIL